MEAQDGNYYLDIVVSHFDEATSKFTLDEEFCRQRNFTCNANEAKRAINSEIRDICNKIEKKQKKEDIGGLFKFRCYTGDILKEHRTLRKVVIICYETDNIE